MADLPAGDGTVQQVINIYTWAWDSLAREPSTSGNELPAWYISLKGLDCSGATRYCNSSNSLISHFSSITLPWKREKSLTHMLTTCLCHYTHSQHLLHLICEDSNGCMSLFKICSFYIENRVSADAGIKFSTWKQYTKMISIPWLFNVS